MDHQKGTSAKTRAGILNRPMVLLLTASLGALGPGDLTEQVEQVARLGVHAHRHRFASEVNEQLDLRTLVAPSGALRVRKRGLLFLTGQISPVRDPVAEEPELLAFDSDSDQSPLERR